MDLSITIWLAVGASILGGIVGAWWALRQPDPNPNGLLGRNNDDNHQQVN